MSRHPARRPSSTSRHDSDKLDAVAVLQSVLRPFVTEEGLSVELDQDALGIKLKTLGQAAKGLGTSDLLGAAVNENADGAGHGESAPLREDSSIILESAQAAFLGVEQIEVENHLFLNLGFNVGEQIFLHPGLAIRRELRNASALQGEIPRGYLRR